MSAGQTRDRGRKGQGCNARAPLHENWGASDTLRGGPLLSHPRDPALTIPGGRAAGRHGRRRATARRETLLGGVGGGASPPKEGGSTENPGMFLRTGGYVTKLVARKLPLVTQVTK